MDASMETENEVVENLIEIIETAHGVEDMVDNTMVEMIESVRTFSEQGLLTSNAGFVLRTADDHEYQITVVQVR